MMKKWIIFLFAFLVLTTFAVAEDADNPFIGAWACSYFIQDGKLLPDDEDLPVSIVWDAEHLILYQSDGSTREALYTREGNICTAWNGKTTFTLEGKDIMIGYEGGLSFILTRIDPLMLNNPFIGTWIPICTVQNNVIEVAQEWTMEAAAIFTANAVQLTSKNSAETYPCIYADGACTLMMDDTQIICTITEDGLLYMSYPEEGQIICIRENEEVPEEISQFYGTWREIAALYHGVLTTDQVPLALRPENGGLLAQLDFSRATVLVTILELQDFPSYHVLCTYADGICTLHYDDMPSYCTIDTNGLMCLRSEDGSWISWLVRTDETIPAEHE